MTKKAMPDSSELPLQKCNLTKKAKYTKNAKMANNAIMAKPTRQSANKRRLKQTKGRTLARDPHVN